MADTTRANVSNPRPKNLNPMELGLKLPPAGIVSLLHRASGVLLFLSIPLVIFLLDVSLRSPAAFSDIYRFMAQTPMKLISILLVWAVAHHAFAGIRFLILDLHIGVEKASSRMSALAVLGLSILFTIVVGVLIW